MTNQQSGRGVPGADTGSARDRRVKIASRWPTRVFVIAGGVTLLAALGLTWLIVRGQAEPLGLDSNILNLIGEWTAAAPWVRDAAEFLGHISDVIPSTIICVTASIILLIMRRWLVALFLGFCAVGGVAVAEILKISVGRHRPPGAEEYMSDLEKSFPSGHAMSGLYVYGALAIVLILFAMHRDSMVLLWVGRLLFAYGILIGLSRIVLGVHWTTDVIAAWLYGSTVLLAGIALLRPDDRIISKDRQRVEVVDAEG